MQSCGSGGYQKIDYQYNIRGWLTDINNFLDLQDSPGFYSDLFAFHINYDNPDGHSNGNVSSLYNGNISETFWISSTDGVLRKYGYRYDQLNRLEDAYYQRPYGINPYCGSYDESLSYDKNGNILSLQRYGHIDNFNYANSIDELEYFYQGNRLTKVTDHSGSPHGFKDDENNTNEPDYLYDDFGNMIHDENKKIELIQYNHLNLPTTLFLDTGTISYLYNAAGQKLRKTVQYLNATYDVSITEYLDGFQYNNSVLQFFSHPEGYVLNTPDSQGDPSYDYVYQYKDHLGNIRVNFVYDRSADDLIVLEENHYYPFGLKHENYNVTKKKMKWESELIGGEEMELKRVRQVPNSGYQYKYNGKEWQDELSLNWYDYHARNYDPAIGRWMNIDPLAENSRRWSPYNYCYNNPMIFVDPDGMQAKVVDGIYIDTEGNKIGEDSLGKEDGRVYVVSGKDVDKVKKATNEGKTIETDEISEYAELPSNDIKEKEIEMIEKAKSDTEREYSYVRIEYFNSSQEPYDHFEVGRKYVNGNNAVTVEPFKHIPDDKKPGAKVKHVSHTHNVEMGGAGLAGRPQYDDKQMVKNHPNATHSVHNTRNNSTYVMRSTGNKGFFAREVIIIEIPTSVYLQKEY
jgi:RHS repeat-associated protein